MRGDYDKQAVMGEICTRLVDGESLRKICRDEHMPAISTVMLWLTQDETLSEQYARAKTEQADTIFQEVLDIADSATNEDVQVARLKIDARKWMAGKLKPKVYGEKIDHVSSDGSMKMPDRILLVAADDDSQDTASA